MFVAVPAIVGAWALAGFYGSLGPALVQRLERRRLWALGGAALFVLAGSGAARHRTSPGRSRSDG